MDFFTNCFSMIGPFSFPDDLASVFQTISLADTLHFLQIPQEKNPKEDILTCDDGSLIVNNQNLVIKVQFLI
jgi:4-diphosphocytidyl-2C-methyl-D-erythritol kinase